MKTLSRRPHITLQLCFLVSALVVCIMTSEAHAQMRQGTRRGFFEASFGPVVGLVNTDRLWAQTSLEVGGHFERSSGGPALSGCFDFLGRPDWFGTEMGVKFRWDIQVRRNLALYLTPTVRVGYALFSHNFDRPRHFFNLQFGFEVRMIFRNRLIVFVRAPSFDIDIFDHVELAFDMGVGLGVTF